MIAIARLYQDSYGANMGARTFCQLSKYFGGVLITDNKKIQALDYPQITHAEAISNIKKFTKLIIYNTKPNMFGGIAPKHTHEVVRLIMAINDVYFYNCDPILDLQLSVPNSHEIAVPGLTNAISKMIHRSTRLDRRNTDLTKHLASLLEIYPYTEEKKYMTCYFGNARQPYRQQQVKSLLGPFGNNALIIGHEHEDFTWYQYTPDFYKYLSQAWTTPIIGDKKLHYETGIPSLRLYEACCSTAIALLDSRYKEPALDERFYFTTHLEFVKMTNQISKDKKLYESMLQVQRKFVKKVIRKYKGKTFDWKVIKKQKDKIIDERSKTLKAEKDNEILQAKKRLIKKGIIKPKRK